MLARSGQEAKAYALAKEALAAGLYDYDLVNALFVLAMRARDFPLAEKALKVRMADWPENRARSLFQLGEIYVEMSKPVEALATFREALGQANTDEKREMLQQMPPAFRDQLAGAAAPGAPQTSAKSK